MKKNIYMIDLSHKSSLGLGSDTMPLQLGLVSAYCLKEHRDRVRFELFKFIEDLDAAVRREPPFMIGASNYVWNIELAYQVLGLIKEQHPEVITVVGGPNYPDVFEEQVEWLQNHPNIDFYIYKDGEIPFRNLAAFLLDNPDVDAAKKAKLKSCHSLLNSRPYFGELEERLRDLSAIPSPYHEGLMDKFFNKRLVPAIQTNRGCPFTCTFCVEGLSYYTKVHKSNIQRNIDDVDYIAGKIKDTRTLRITDSNFGMFTEDIELCTHLSQMQDEIGYPEYIMCSAGKNKKERILKCNDLVKGAMRLTASVQSLDERVLGNIKRSNISKDAIMELSDRVGDTMTPSYSEIILALPSSTLEIERNNFKELVECGIGNITQHQLSLIPATEMETKASRQAYQMEGKFRPIQRCLGQYSWGDQEFNSIEIEEICVSTNTLSYSDYLEARRLYLTVGMLYNDRVFGEIIALLGLLDLSTWEWLYLIHKNIPNIDPRIRQLYEAFTEETKNELWDSREALVRDVTGDFRKYTSSECGGNLIYKYRSKALMKEFDALHAVAFEYLRRYVEEQGIHCEQLVEDVRHFSYHRKSHLLDIGLEVEKTYDYNIFKLVTEPVTVRRTCTVEDLYCPTKVRISHSPEQREMIKRQLEFYDVKDQDLTFLISRFPIRRYYRSSELV